MSAAATDKFKKSYSFLSKTLSSSIGSGDTTIALNNATNIPTDTAVDFVIDRVDSNGNATASLREICTGVVSGSSIISVTRGQMGTTAQAHNSGAVLELVVSAQTHNDMVTGLLVDHTQAGHHTLDSSDTITSAKVVTGLRDTNAKNMLDWNPAGASAVNELQVSNATTGNAPDLAAVGTDSNIDMTFTPKGTGQVKLAKRFDSWVTGLTAPTTVTALGNRSYTVVVNSTDYTDRLSPGARLRFTRTVSAPTQCTSLNGTTQYYNKTSPAGMTFTNNFVVSAWIKVTSYAQGTIASRYNGTSGWLFYLTSTGNIVLQGANAGSANFSKVTSVQSVPLNRWVHVTAQLDMLTFTATTTTSYTMIDGLDVPATVARGGTNPTALVQAGDLQIGADNGGTDFFPGKIAQAAIYNAKVTQANVLATISQTLGGSETSLISAYSFNNSINDLNANANNLTAQGSAVATNADSPFGIQADGTNSATLEYGIVMAATFSTNTTLTVQVPEGGAIPTSGGVTALAYSGTKVPYQFPAQQGKWQILASTVALQTISVGALNTWYPSSIALKVPIGEWMLGYQLTWAIAGGSAGAVSGVIHLSSTVPTNSTYNYDFASGLLSSAANLAVGAQATKRLPTSQAAAATYTLYAQVSVVTGTTNWYIRGTDGVCSIIAENAYL